MNKLACNTCRRIVDGIAYRTACHHFICPACAQIAFAKGNSCPVCNCKLKDFEVREIIVGLNPAIESVDSAFQILLQSPAWDSIMENHRKLGVGMIELTSFICAQVSVDADQDRDSRSILENRVDALQGELIAANKQIQSFESFAQSENEKLSRALNATEKEFCDLKEAFKEKNRKCLAWEKAYGTLRDQISGGQGVERAVEKPRLPAPDTNPHEFHESNSSFRRRTEITTLSHSFEMPPSPSEQTGPGTATSTSRVYQTARHPFPSLDRNRHGLGDSGLVSADYSEPKRPLPHRVQATGPVGSIDTRRGLEGCTAGGAGSSLPSNPFVVGSVSSSRASGGGGGGTTPAFANKQVKRSSFFDR